MSKQRTHRTWWDRLLSGVLCLALVLGLLPAAGLVQTADAHWADPYGEQMVEWGVMQPASDLRLGATTTRAEFIAMCNRAFGFHVLGDMPFKDVPKSAWYAEDINIAYHAGYVEGTSRTTASPLALLTREEAAVILARCLRLRETVGESLGFTDSRQLSDWSRGLIGALATENIVDGLPDGSFAPKKYITRGEVAAMLVRAIGTPIKEAGEYELDKVYGPVMITSSNVTLRDTVIMGNLYITGGVDLGNVLLENVTVFGKIIISGGGESHEGRSSVILRNVVADELVVDSMVNQFVTVSAYGLTDIPLTSVRSDAYLDDSCAEGHGLHYIEQTGASLLQLAGSIKEVKNKTPLSLLQLVKGTAKKITIDEEAPGSELLIAENTVVEELRLDVATRVYGTGDIIDLIIWAADCEVEILPEHVEIRPGITATVAGEVIGSTEADQLSSEPRLLSGYPSVSSNLTPITAEGLFAGNKPGTIYWAVSARADGSVSEKDLINNPTYGGIILKDGDKSQSGGITAEARTRYAQPITGLEPDGSYYISAILEDDRGNRSPLKVYAFTTPDDTVPAFVDGPRMTKVSCEVAQVTAMASKSCTLYWVLLTHGATAPTEQSFRTGSFGGNYGTGSISVTKNVPVSIQVNTSRLQEKTDYDLYLWLTDGTLSSKVVKVENESGKTGDPSFTTPDETSPVVSNVRQTKPLADAVEFSFEISEAPSTLYWVVVPEADNTFIRATEDLTSQRIQMRVEGGTGSTVIISGSKKAAGERVETTVGAADFKNALKYSVYGTHNFKLYYVGKDEAGNYSVVDYIIIHTLDNERPTVSIAFSAAKYSTPADQEAGRNPKPLADTDITLIFSEQVKGEGGEDAKTFVELYNEVDSYLKLGYTETEEDIKAGSDTTNPLTIAKNKLGEELEKYIELYYVEDSMPGIQLRPQGINARDGEFGWINLREATVKQNMDDGTVELTLANGKAVQLGGGMQYYFHFQDIFDDAYTPNPLQVMRNGKVDPNGNMDPFTTVYAQVKLSIPKVTKIESTNGNIDGIRLDMAFDLDPQSTGRAPDSEYWDIIIWTNTTVRFDLYRQIIKKDGAEVENDKSHGWELIVSGYGQNGDKGKEGDSAFEMIPNGPSQAISLNKRWLATVTDPAFVYPTVKDGLDENYIYRYGVHFTEVNSIPEDDGLDATQKPNAKKQEPIAWDAEIAWDVSVIAGDINVIQSRITSGNIKEKYTEYKGLGYFSEIGDVNDGEASILTCYRSYEDLKVPSFRTGFPTIKPGSNSITMEVGLDGSGKGTVYYVVAPAAGAHSIGTSVNGTTITNADGTETPNDGSKANTTFTEKTYIPEDGNDRDTGANKKWIQFLPANEGEKGGKYDSPKASAIVDGTYYGRAGVVSDSQPVDSVVETIKVEGLVSNTWYYIYLVLQGGGDADDVVQIYRVKTDPITPPVIEMATGNDETSVTMTVNSRNTGAGNAPMYDGGILYYALVNSNSLPDIFKQYYNWVDLPAGATDKRGPYTGDTKAAAFAEYKKADTSITGTSVPSTFMTVLDAMITRYSGTNADGRHYFDMFAEEFGLMNDVMNYISTTSTDSRFQTPAYRNIAGTTTNPTTEDFRGRMEDTSEYIVLACARNVNSDKSTGKFYGFAAVRSLYKRDTEPPVFVPEAAYPKYIMLGGADPVNPKGEERADLVKAAWNGTFSVTFNKDVYFHDNATNTLYTLRYGGTPGANEKLLTASGVLGGSAVSSNHVTRGTASGTVGSTIELAANGIKHGETVVIFGSGLISNADNYTTKFKLTLTFDATLTYKDFGTTDTFLKDMTCPGFRVSWTEVK